MVRIWQKRFDLNYWKPINSPGRCRGHVFSKPRAALVFHEPAENYYVTDKGIDYLGKYGAHQHAADREINSNFRYNSNNPGQYNSSSVPAISKARSN